MIVMLDCSIVDAEVSDVSIEITGFDKYKEMLKVDRSTNSVLAITYDEP